MFYCYLLCFYNTNSLDVMLLSSDDRVLKASALGAVDSGLIPSRVKLITLKLVFTASLLDVQQKGQREEQAGKFTCCTVGKET